MPNKQAEEDGFTSRTAQEFAYMTQYIAGPESEVTTDNSRFKAGTSIAALRDGGYVITWSSQHQYDDDGAMDVFAQRYDDNGDKIGGEFQVNSYTSHSQYVSEVTGLVDGGFVIVWQSSEQDGSGWGTYAQLYDASGARVGEEQRVNTQTAGDQYLPDIAALSAGGYVVTWTLSDQNGAVSDVYARRYDASGFPIGGEQQVNSDADNSQYSSKVVGLADGGYLIAWTDTDFSVWSDTKLFAQRFDASGQRVGGEFLINTYADSSSPTLDDIAALEDGGFVVTSTSYGGEDRHDDVFAQRYDAAGAAVGTLVRVNNGPSADRQTDSRITALADGGYAIIWLDTDPSIFGGIYATIFDASGAMVAENQLGPWTDVSMYSGWDVAALPNGSFIVTRAAWVWPVDEAQPGIFARRFTPVSSMVGDSGDNSLTGTAEADTIPDQAGNDLIAGLSGNDMLSGGTGADIFYGGDGNDTISSDRPIGFDGNTDVDQVYGGAGNDMMFAGYGDIVDGGAGLDTLNLSYVGASHGITGDTKVLFAGQPLTPGGGTVRNIERFDAVALTNFDDVMVIGDQADPATAYGYDGDDHLIGQENRVVLSGGYGNDLLVGSTANDMIYGDAGNDILIGHHGMDELFGGAGSDRFIINQLDMLDRIIDFQHGVDKIDVSDIDANVLTPGDQAFSFIGTELFSGVAGQLRIGFTSSATYIVEGDVNGDGQADLIIDLGLPSALTHGDFLL